MNFNSKSSNINKVLSIIIPSLIISVAYYLAYSWDNEIYDEFRKIGTITLTTVGFLGGTFMYFHAQNDRSKKIFSIILLMLAMASFLTCINIYRNDIGIQKRILSPFVILYGGTYAFLMSIYPIEVLRPNWLDYKKILLGFTPTLILFIAACVIVKFWGKIERFETLDDCIVGILSLKTLVRIGICMYPTILLYFIYHLKKEYTKWGEENFVITDKIDVEWLDYYFIGYLIILGSYMYQINFYNPLSSPIHGTLFSIFTFSFYNKIFNHESPYPRGYIKEIEEQENEIILMQESDTNINCYKQILLNWFESEKPYLKKDFRLMDINEKIPLNRTYLSKLINEEFNTNFNSFIADYRLKESIKMLDENPECTIKSISEECGFSSQSVFTRTFINKYGVTPSAYRNITKIDSSIKINS